MSRESRLRLKLESALDDIDRMEEENYTQLLSPKIAEALKLIDLLEDQWGIDLEEALEDETDHSPRHLYDMLCAAKVRKDREEALMKSKRLRAGRASRRATRSSGTGRRRASTSSRPSKTWRPGRA